MPGQIESPVGPDQEESSLEPGCRHGRKQTRPSTPSGAETPHGSSTGEDAGILSLDVNESETKKCSAIRRLWNWKPKPARYDAENPPKFTIWLNMLFGFGELIPCPDLPNPGFYFSTQLTASLGRVLHGLKSLLQPTNPQ